MSRTVTRQSPYEIAYGHDHVFGFFIQVFDMRRWGDEDGGLILDVDQQTPEMLVEIAGKYGVTIPLLDKNIGFN